MPLYLWAMVNSSILWLDMVITKTNVFFFGGIWPQQQGPDWDNPRGCVSEVSTIQSLYNFT